MPNQQKNNKILFSIIIAVYKREQELKELLISLQQQTYKNFEVIVVDDGSPKPIKDALKNFNHSLNYQYFYKENAGPGLSRNYGMAKANGDYFIFLDSDTIAPPNYLKEIFKAIKISKFDFFGGADAAADDFNALQKAISFAMTSVISTGGIRGKKKAVTKFQPRSFNMGISRSCYEATGGFSNMRIGEDPDLSMTLWEKGFKSGFIDNAWVYHKRRNNLKSFGKQVRSFGRARPLLNQRHPKYKKISFWFPSFFFIGFCLSIIAAIFGNFWLLTCYATYFIFVFILAFIKYRSMKVSILAMVAVFIQMEMYGLGFIESQIKINLLGQKPEEAFPKHFTQ